MEDEVARRDNTMVENERLRLAIYTIVFTLRLATGLGGHTTTKWNEMLLLDFTMRRANNACGMGPRRSFLIHLHFPFHSAQ